MNGSRLLLLNKKQKFLGVLFCWLVFLLIYGGIVFVFVRDNNVDQALRALKKKMQREGVFREIKLRRHFEKPSEKRAREMSEAIRRTRKLLKKRMDRDGY
jgi:small subunit ribosomal protein S21